MNAGRVRDGVGASCVTLPPGDWPTVLAFLVQRFPGVAAAEWRLRMQSGNVLSEQGQVLPVDTAYLPRSKVYYYRSLALELPIPFEETVLYQDEHIVVADKPHFLPVTPSGRYLQETLLIRLKRRLGLDDLVPLHRIDRDTAGLVLFSVNPASRGAYAALFRERNIVKHYEAVAPWREGLDLPAVLHSRIVPSEAFMTMREEPGEPNSETRIALIAKFTADHGSLAHYSLSPHTGRRHQLRVQMAGLGLPILNDNIYPVLSPECPLGTAPDYSQPLQLLARRLAFKDPLTGTSRVFESQLRLQAVP